MARSQSSLKRGSSFPWEVRKGRSVDRRERWVVRERRVRGWVVEREGEVGGGVMRSI